METKIAAAHWSINNLGSEQLPGIASAWLEKGLSSPTLIILAGETQPIMSEVGPMFGRVLHELNIDIPTQRDATILLSKIIAQEIVDGKMPPYTGAREIENLSDICEGADIPFTFNGLASELEDFREDYRQRYYGKEHCQKVVRDIEQRIIEEAHKLLAE